MAMVIAIDKLAQLHGPMLASSLICLAWKTAVENSQSRRENGIDQVGKGERVEGLMAPFSEHYCMQMKSEMSMKGA